MFRFDQRERPSRFGSEIGIVVVRCHFDQPGNRDARAESSQDLRGEQPTVGQMMVERLHQLVLVAPTIRFGRGAAGRTSFGRRLHLRKA